MGNIIQSSSACGISNRNTGEANMAAARSSATEPAKAPAWAAASGRVSNYVLNDFGGGPRPWKLAWVINFQKLGTLPILVGSIAWYHNTSIAAWLCLAHKDR